MGKPDDDEDRDNDYRTQAMDRPDDTGDEDEGAADEDDTPEGYEPEPDLTDDGTDTGDDTEPDADEMGDTSDEDADDTGAGEEDSDELPGSVALTSLGEYLQAGLDTIEDLMKSQENAKVKKALVRLQGDFQDAVAALDALHSQEYGGADEDTPPAGDTAAEGESADEPDDETREKALAAWRGRLKALGLWLTRQKGTKAGDTEEARRLRVIEQKVARLESAAYKAFGLKAV